MCLMFYIKNSKNLAFSFYCSSYYVELMGWKSWKGMISTENIHLNSPLFWTLSSNSQSHTPKPQSPFRRRTIHIGLFEMITFENFQHCISEDCNFSQFLYGNLLSSLLQPTTKILENISAKRTLKFYSSY